MPTSAYNTPLPHNATCCIESEPLYIKSLDNGLVEVTDKCCKKKEHCVLCHEGFGQSVPSETIVHIIEDTLDFILRFLAMTELSLLKLCHGGKTCHEMERSTP